MPVGTLVDVETLVVQWLKEYAATPSSELEGYADRISSRTGKGQAYPAITLFSVGGPAIVEGHFSATRLQVDVWGSIRTTGATPPAGGYRKQARDLAFAVEKAIRAVRNQVRDEGLVTNTTLVIGIRPIEEPETERPRFGFDVRVLAHPLP